jgi:ribose transport system substrate-binding protein
MAFKQILAGMAVALGVATAAHAADPDWLKSPKKPLSDVTVGFANLGPGVNAYAATYLKVFNDYAKELGIKTVVLDSQADAAKQASQINDLIAQQVDSMVVWPVNGKGIVPFVKKAYDAHIPVVITNSNIDSSGEQYIAAYTGPDDYHEAFLAGQMMVEALKGKGNIVMLNGIPGYTVTQLRIDGFKEAIKDHPDVKILDSQPAYFSQEKAQTLMENYITRFGKKIDGVFSVDSGVGAGALSAVQAAVADGKLDAKHVQMVDATIFGGIYDAIKSGDYYGSVVQSPEDDAKVALKTAVMVAEGMEVPRKVFLPMPIVTGQTIGGIPHPSF